MPALDLMLAIFAFVWGAVWGSFLNVVIHRVPLGESILTPPSHCPRCGRTIRWYHNIPIVSYVALGGKCGYCGEPISVRYPLVELTAAMLSVAAWEAVAYNPFIPSLPMALATYIFLFYFVMSLLAITFIDLDHMIIPDVISLPAVAVGILFNFLLGAYRQMTWLDSLIGAAAGAGVIALVIIGYYLATRREGMGWGDAKLMAMLGAFLGWRSLFFVLFAGSIQGLIYTAAALLTGHRHHDPDDEEEEDETTSVRRLKIPFGPFLALAGLEWLFFSHWIEGWFQAIFRL